MESPETLTKMTAQPARPSLVALALLALVGGLGACATLRNIPGTLVADTKQNREIIDVCERYRHALEDRDSGQLLAMATITPMLQRTLQTARTFYDTRKRSIFEDILHEEIRTGTRLVYENNGFTVFCPYASRAPFELAIYPKRQCPDFHGLSAQETTQLADVLQTSLRKLNRALDHAPYNLMLFTAPTRSSRASSANGRGRGTARPTRTATAPCR